MADLASFTAPCPRCAQDCEWTTCRREYVGDHGTADRTAPHDTCPCWTIPAQRTSEP